MNVSWKSKRLFGKLCLKNTLRIYLKNNMSGVVSTMFFSVQRRPSWGIYHCISKELSQREQKNNVAAITATNKTAIKCHNKGARKSMWPMMILEFHLTYALQVVFTLVYCASELPMFSVIVLLPLVHKQSNLFFHTIEKENKVDITNPSKNSICACSSVKCQF